jgi:outer membrane receptor protein involved in Fe transport
MAVNVPLVEGKLAARVVAGYEDRGGWVDKPNLQQKDVNSGTLNNVRAKIKAQPTDSLSIELSAWHSRDEYDGFTGANRGWTNPSAVNESVLVDYNIYGLSVGYALPAFTISSTTGYMNLKNDSLYDLSWVGVPLIIGTVNNSDVFSEELIFNSSLEGPWRWTAGAMYRDGTEQLNQIFGGSLPSAAGIADTASTSVAVFGEVTRTLGKLEFTAGLRRFEDKVTYDQPAAPSTNQTAFFGEVNFHATSPRVVLTWHAADDALLYGSYAEGFRSGGTLSPDRVSNGLSALKPDTLKNYEVGTKGELLDGRLKYDVSVFYIDWQDIQQTRTITLPSGIPVSAQLNGDSASGFGSDVGLTLQPIEGLTLGLNFGWSDLTLDKDVLSVVGGVNTAFAKAGNRIPFSPEYTGGVSADYAFPLGTSGFEAVLSASASYVSSQIFRTILFDQIRSATGDNTTIGRVGFSIQAPKHWELNFFINNINNEQDVVVPDLFSLVPMRARPRTIGAQFAYEY